MLRDVTTRVLLLPVLLGQAIFVRLRIPKLAEATGRRSGVMGQGPRLRLLVLGDSSAAGVGAETQDEALLGQLLRQLGTDYTVSYDLVAKTGARTLDALGWMRHRPAQDYDVVICALGANDVIKRVSMRDFLQHQQQLLAHLLGERQAQLVLVSALPPVSAFPALPQPLRRVLGRRALAFDTALAALVEDQQNCIRFGFDGDLDVTDMAHDGFHPGPRVYTAWAQAAAKIIHTQPLRLDGDRTAP